LGTNGKHKPIPLSKADYSGAAADGRPGCEPDKRRFSVEIVNNFAEKGLPSSGIHAKTAVKQGW
jgi:hypothetical protein